MIVDHKGKKTTLRIKRQKGALFVWVTWGRSFQYSDWIELKEDGSMVYPDNMRYILRRFTMRESLHISKSVCSGLGRDLYAKFMLDIFGVEEDELVDFTPWYYVQKWKM